MGVLAVGLLLDSTRSILLFRRIGALRRIDYKSRRHRRGANAFSGEAEADGTHHAPPPISLSPGLAVAFAHTGFFISSVCLSYCDCLSYCSACPILLDQVEIWQGGHSSLAENPRKTQENPNLNQQKIVSEQMDKPCSVCAVATAVSFQFPARFSSSSSSSRNVKIRCVCAGWRSDGLTDLA